MRRRLVYTFAGTILAAIPLLLVAWLVKNYNLLLFAFLGGPLAVWWGERRGGVPTADEISKPQTLFGDKPVRRKPD